MATIREKNDSRQSTVSTESPSVELLYTVTGTEDDTEVKTLVQSTLPAFYADLPFQQFSYNHLGNGIWDVQARYGKQQPKTAGDDSFSFDTTGGTVHITHQTLQTYSFTPESAGPVSLAEPPSDYTDYNDGINVVHGTDGHPKAEGVDVVIPAFAFTIQRIMAHPLDGNYVQSLFELTGAVNDDLVSINISGVQFNFAAGELLFKGATGSVRGSDDWEITLNFEASRNKTGLEYGTITNVDKRGHDYLWIANETGADNDKLVPVPTQVNVEQLYPDEDLSVLFA